jgi:ribosomal protein S18 acetylase RimI-like enzyme
MVYQGMQVTKAKTYPPEIEQAILAELERGLMYCKVSYSLNYDSGYVLEGKISLSVVTDELDYVEFGDGEIYQVCHGSVDEDYLVTAADAMSGHFETVAYCIGEQEEELINYTHSYYLSHFDLFPQFQGKGYGRKAADLAIRSAGALGSPVFIYPAEDEEIPHEKLKKFWLSLHPRAKWDAKYNTVHIIDYNLNEYDQTGE